MSYSPFMRRARLVLFAVVLSALGCPKEEKKKDDDKAEKKKGDDDKAKKKGDDDKADKKKGDDDKAEKKKSDDDKAKKDEPAPTDGRTIDGFAVPAWHAPKRSAATCKLSTTQKKTLEAISAGTATGWDEGTVNVADLVTELKPTCAGAGAVVSQALNAGGYTRYAKKKYAAANHWWTRALAADPTNTFARYNLACSLALDGKAGDAVWNVQQLVKGAEGEDPRAIHYLRKAKSDTDLDSVRTNADFKAAMTAGEKTLGTTCKGKTVPGKNEKGKKDCVQICNGFGTAGGCDADATCTGSDTFGDGLVPFCLAKPKTVCPKGTAWRAAHSGKMDESEPVMACVHWCNEQSDCKTGTCGGWAYDDNGSGQTIPVAICWPP